jgi:MFS family permease
MAAHGEPSTSGNVRSPLPAEDEAPYPRRSYAWVVVAILIGTAVLSYTDRQVLSLLVDPIRHDLRISDTEVSILIGTAFAVVYGTAGIPFGLLADRTSRRNLIFFGVVVWSIGTVACGFAHSFGELFAARVVVGLGESVLSPSAISLISDYFPPSRRGLAVGSYLSGIAIGNGASILIGGGALQLVEAGVFAGTPIAVIAPWRLVLLVIGSPGLLWSLAILAIREPQRRAAIAPDASGTSGAGGASGRHAAVWRVAPIYLVVATASLVDNAVGAWAPTLLIRDFGRDAARVGLQLGLLLTIGFGGGVLLGGWLSDRLGRGGRWSRKLAVCLVSSLVILPVCWAIDAAQVTIVIAAVPLYFALSGIVTACGFSSILDVVPNRQRGFAMAVSFFLNVALGAGLGPTSVALVSDRGFGSAAGLGPAIALTAGAGFFLIATVLVLTLATLKLQQR